MNGHPHDDGSSQEYSIEYTVLRPFKATSTASEVKKMNGSKILCCGQCPLERIVPFFFLLDFLCADFYCQGHFFVPSLLRKLSGASKGTT